MKIARLSKLKAASRRHLVVRIFTEIDRDYRWWTYQDTEPEAGYLEFAYVKAERVYPPTPAPATRKPLKLKLSRRALRKRLYQRHVPAVLWPELLATYANSQLVRIPGEMTIRQRHGYAVSKAVTRHVRSTFVVFDEFWHIAKGSMGSLVEHFASGRKYNAAPVLCEQAEPSGGTSCELVLG